MSYSSFRVTSAIVTGMRKMKIIIMFNMAVKGPDSCSDVFANDTSVTSQWTCKFQGASLRVKIDADGSTSEVGNGTHLLLRSGVIAHKHSDQEYANAMPDTIVRLAKVS